MATLTVGPAGRDYTTIQAAVNAASYGDIIQCDANVTFVEQDFLLPNKGAGSSYITITTNASAGSLPPAGHRTGPAYETFMPRIKSAGFGVSTVNLADGAHHYKFQHVHFPHVPSGYNSMFAMGTGEQKLKANHPHHVIIDQCYFEGDAIDGQRCGVNWNAGEGEITNSYFEKCTAMGQDAQCIAGNNGTGPLLIDNNYLSGGAENVIFGGSDPWMRWRMTTTGNVSTTGADVSLVDPTGRDIGDLVVGDLLAIDVESGAGITLEFPTIATFTRNSASTATLTWTPALSANPDTTAGSIRHDVIMDGVTITNNLFTKDLAWRDGILGTPVNPSATLGAGGTLATTYYYKVQAGATGYVDNAVNSLSATQVNATAAGGNGTITVDWDAVTNAEYYRVWRGTSSNGQTQYVQVTAPTSVLVDDGSLSWTTATIPTSASKWVVKNLFELKCCLNVTISGNIFRYLWEDTNIGARQAWWLKAENQNNDGGSWTSTIRNMTIEYNLVESVFGWLSLQGRYCVNGSPIVRPAPIKGVTIRHNLIIDCTGTVWGESPSNTANVMLVQNGVEDLTIDHNTVIAPGMRDIMTFDSEHYDLVNFTYTSNMALRNTSGWSGSPAGEGNDALDLYIPTRTITNNAIGGAQSGNFSGSYPTNNNYPTVANWEAAFTNYSSDGNPLDYVIAPGHAYLTGGADGQPIGANIAAVLAAIAYAEDGIIPDVITSTGRRGPMIATSIFG